MENPNRSRRRELALILVSELAELSRLLDCTAAEVEKGSCAFYEEAFQEKQPELESVLNDYQRNMDRIKELHGEMTAAINAWYAFSKDEREMGKITYPIRFHSRKKALYKTIERLNGEISSLAINNRFIKEKLVNLEQQLEIKAVSLARAGNGFREYEQLLLKQKSLSDELKYLLPTIPGLCPAELSGGGLERLAARCR
jgi:predicted  nucleic acid-binding Zn-ribbon protein